MKPTIAELEALLDAPARNININPDGSLTTSISEVEELKEALREAMFTNGSKTVSKCIDYDPAGSTYEVDWSPMMKRWAKLADVDLDKYEIPTN